METKWEEFEIAYLLTHVLTQAQSGQVARKQNNCRILLPRFIFEIIQALPNTIFYPGRGSANSYV